MSELTTTCETVLDWWEITGKPADWEVTHTDALNDPDYWDRDNVSPSITSD